MSLRMPRKYAKKASSLKNETSELQYQGGGTSRSETNSTRGKKKRVIGSDSNARTIVASNPFDDDHNHHHPAHQIHPYQPPLPQQMQHPQHHMHHHHHSPVPMTPTGMQGSPYAVNQVPPQAPPMHHQAAQQQYQMHQHPHQQHQHPMPPNPHQPHQHQMGPMGPHGPIRAPPAPHHMIEVAPYPQQVMPPTPPPQQPPGSRAQHNVYGFQGGYAISSPPPPPPPSQQASVQQHQAPIMHQMEPPGQSPMQPPYQQVQQQPLQPQPQQQQQPYNTINSNVYCGKCQREIYQDEPNIICKAGCRSCFHLLCSGLTKLACDLLMKESLAEWACDRCTSGNRCVPFVKYKT